ncbi:MAG: hypothetical protein ACK55Z_29680, partial [bacterium]
MLDAGFHAGGGIFVRDFDARGAPGFFRGGHDDAKFIRVVADHFAGCGELGFGGVPFFIGHIDNALGDMARGAEELRELGNRADGHDAAGGARQGRGERAAEG